LPSVPCFSSPPGGDDLVLVLADEPVRRDRLEVRHVPHRTDVPPGPLDAEEPLQQELVGDVGEDAADVHGRESRGLDLPPEGVAQGLAAVAEGPLGVAIGPGGLEEEFLEADAAAEAPAGLVQHLLVVVLFRLGELRRQDARRLQRRRVARPATVALDGDVHVGLRAAFPHGLEDLLRGLLDRPAQANGVPLDARELARADLLDGGHALALDADGTGRLFAGARRGLHRSVLGCGRLHHGLRVYRRLLACLPVRQVLVVVFEVGRFLTLLERRLQLGGVSIVQRGGVDAVLLKPLSEVHEIASLHVGLSLWDKQMERCRELHPCRGVRAHGDDRHLPQDRFLHVVERPLVLLAVDGPARTD
jgi:hypothetical protein